MEFFSTNNHELRVPLKLAVLKGLAPDNGLYMPVSIPKLDPKFIEESAKLSFNEIGEHVIRALFSDDLSSNQITELVSHTLSFEAPLIQVEDNIFALELFHGPTLAFKDFGARFCSKLMSFLISENSRRTKVLVATSGDTGSAVANGFFDCDGIDVVILYPKGKVSEIQEKQFTTLGGNITSLAIDGDFDDCQKMVKEAFLDKELNDKLVLTSANSINVARWIPQCLYYFYSWSRLPKNKKSVFSVPSGNFGNLAAGLFAKKMGLPIDTFIAATNSNKIVPDFLNGNEFLIKNSIETISNSMDVGNPSNFPRMLELFDGDVKELRKNIIGYYFSDEETKSAMKALYNASSYVMDPHGAIGYAALKKFILLNSDYQGVFLETAHPVKFKSTVEQILEIEIEVPENLKALQKKVKTSIDMANSYADFHSFLLT